MKLMMFNMRKMKKISYDFYELSYINHSSSGLPLEVVKIKRYINCNRCIYFLKDPDEKVMEIDANFFTFEGMELMDQVQF